MIIFPAIDIIKGKPVRLFKGDFSTAEQVADDVLETADGFVKAGAQWVHMVDLDGSLQKKRANAKVFTEVAANTPLKVEVGGGIRTMQDIDYYRNNGIARVILGSVALKNPDLVKTSVKEFGPKNRILILSNLQKEWKIWELKPLSIPIFQRTVR